MSENEIVKGLLIGLAGIGIALLLIGIYAMSPKAAGHFFFYRRGALGFTMFLVLALLMMLAQGFCAFQSLMGW